MKKLHYTIIGVFGTFWCLTTVLAFNEWRGLEFPTTGSYLTTFVFSLAQLVTYVSLYGTSNKLYKASKTSKE